MKQLHQMDAIEKRLWKAADTLRANSELASNEYFMPVMGLVFLRHAYSRYLGVKIEIEKTLPSRGGKTRALTKEDFSGRGAIFLNEDAQFDSLVRLGDADDRAEAIITAMESISKDYTQLTGQLPSKEYRDIPNEVLGQLLRTLNPDELRKADGDIFGRIYEYFLTQFADQGAQTIKDSEKNLQIIIGSFSNIINQNELINNNQGEQLQAVKDVNNMMVRVFSLSQKSKDNTDDVLGNAKTVENLSRELKTALTQFCY